MYKSKRKGDIRLQKIYKILPKYAILPISMCLVFNAFAYFGTRLFTTGMYHHNISIFIDDKTPFVPFMVVFYILAYVSWVVGFTVIGRESKEVCFQVTIAEQMSKIVCMLCFIFLPCTIVRPEVNGSDVFSWLTRLIYSMDSPDNLFPSIHCLENWICFRGAMKCKKVGKGYKITMFVMALLVFASTVMIKQHVFLDIVSAVLLVELMLFISKKFDLGRIYFKVEKKLKDRKRN